MLKINNVVVVRVSQKLEEPNTHLLAYVKEHLVMQIMFFLGHLYCYFFRKKNMFIVIDGVGLLVRRVLFFSLPNTQC